MALFFGKYDCSVDENGITLVLDGMLSEAFNGRFSAIKDAISKKGAFKNAVAQAKRDFLDEDDGNEEPETADGSTDTYAITEADLTSAWQTKAIEGLGAEPLTYKEFFDNLSVMCAFISDENRGKCGDNEVFVKAHDMKAKATEQIKDEVIAKVLGFKPGAQWTFDNLTAVDGSPKSMKTWINDKAVTGDSATLDGKDDDICTAINIMSAGYSSLGEWSAFLKFIYGVQ